MKCFIGAVFAALFFIPQTLLALAMTAYPVEMHMSAGKPGFYHIHNQSDRAIAVVVETMEWQIDEEGLETNPSTDEMIAYPTHFILKGHQKRKIKVSFIGKLGNAEKAFRVLIRELPVQLETKEQNSGLYMAVAYKTACYVTPRKVSPDIRIKNAKIEGENLVLTVVNQGTAHQHLGRVKLFFSSEKGEPIVVSPTDVAAVMEKENLHAKHYRTFNIPLKDTLLPTQNIKQLLMTYENEDGRTFRQKASLKI